MPPTRRSSKKKAGQGEQKTAMTDDDADQDLTPEGVAILKSRSPRYKLDVDEDDEDSSGKPVLQVLDLLRCTRFPEISLAPRSQSS